MENDLREIDLQQAVAALRDALRPDPTMSRIGIIFHPWRRWYERPFLLWRRRIQRRILRNLTKEE